MGQTIVEKEGTQIVGMGMGIKKRPRHEEGKEFGDDMFSPWE